MIISTLQPRLNLSLAPTSYDHERHALLSSRNSGAISAHLMCIPSSLLSIAPRATLYCYTRCLTSSLQNGSNTCSERNIGSKPQLKICKPFFPLVSSLVFELSLHDHLVQVSCLILPSNQCHYHFYIFVQLIPHHFSGTPSTFRPCSQAQTCPLYSYVFGCYCPFPLPSTFSCYWFLAFWAGFLRPRCKNV